MSNTILKKITKIDKKVKRHFGGQDNSYPSVVDQGLKWLPIVLSFIPAKKESKTTKTFVKKLKLIILSKLILNSIVVPLKKNSGPQKARIIFKI